VVVVRGLGDPAGYVGALGVTIDATGVPGRGGAGGFAPNATGGAGTNGSSQRVLVL
jgi:hypothetical protein